LSNDGLRTEEGRKRKEVRGKGWIDFREVADGGEIGSGTDGEVVDDANCVAALFYEIPDQAGPQKTTTAGNQPAKRLITGLSINISTER